MKNPEKTRDLRTLPLFRVTIQNVGMPWLGGIVASTDGTKEKPENVYKRN